MTDQTPAKTILALLERPGIRYFAASPAALALDYVVTLALFHLLGLSLSVAAGIAFLAVGLAFYFVHEFWTFRRESSGVSGRRLVGNLAVLVTSGFVRVGVIFTLEAWREPESIWVTVYFIAGVACSFTTNFVLNRFFIFRDQGATGPGT